MGTAWRKNRETCLWRGFAGCVKKWAPLIDSLQRIKEFTASFCFCHMLLRAQNEKTPAFRSLNEKHSVKVLGKSGNAQNPIAPCKGIT